MAKNQNYTLGRGKLYFSRFIAGGQVPEGFEYVGNTPELSFTIESENLDHFSSDAGVREKDASVPLSTNRTGSFTTDAVNPENISYFFFGTRSLVTIVGGAVVDEPIPDIIEGRYYQLGQTPTNPTGSRPITAVTVEFPLSTNIAAAGNWEVDLTTGMFHVLSPAADLADGNDIFVSYTVTAGTREQILSGSEPVEGALKFIADNPEGHDFNYDMPWVKITPNGDYNLKGDEWQTIPFNLEILKRSAAEAIYIDGLPFAKEI
jgi:hypothetical protein